MSTFVRLLIVSAVAIIMAVIGMELISLRDGHHVDFDTLVAVVPRSILIWIVFSFMLRVRPALVGIYIGLLSPFLGALMFLQPFALLIVFKNLLICLCVGAVTGALISLVSREWSFS
jgi:hypothetical protein